MATTTPSQNALTAIFPLKAEAVDTMRESLKQPFDGAGLDQVGTVHFARIFVFEPNNPAGIASNLAAVITTYDHDFGQYIQDFVNEAGVADFFNKFLLAIDDPAAQACIPVQQNADQFADFIQGYDVTNPAHTPWGAWYSAYPALTVQNILHPKS